MKKSVLENSEILVQLNLPSKSFLDKTLIKIKH